MNDRYLYKAKRTDTGEWVEGYLSHPHCTDSEKGVESYYFKERDENGWYSQRIVEASTICQCTGLKDKNGKLIYENDILIGFLDNLYPEYATYTRVLWNNSGFCANENHSEDIAPLDEFVQIHFEVCGNIFDNPELLEVD